MSLTIERDKMRRELALAYKTGWAQAHFERDSGEGKKSELTIEGQAQRFADRRIIQMESQG